MAGLTSPSVIRDTALSSHQGLNVTDHANFKDLCAAIDLIATTRARAIRSTFCAKSITRPSDNTHDIDGERRMHLDDLLDQHSGLERAQMILRGKDPKGVIGEDICAWIAQMAQEEANLITRMPIAVQDSKVLCDEVKTFVETDSGSVSACDKALESYDAKMRGFFEDVTNFINACWIAYDTARSAEVEQAIQARKLIENTLMRLEKIGKHVRLVSLNASVEASRVGDAGRGLAVIATEFKSLAEEIQGLSSSARSNIDQLVK